MMATLRTETSVSAARLAARAKTSSAEKTWYSVGVTPRAVARTVRLSLEKPVFSTYEKAIE